MGSFAFPSYRNLKRTRPRFARRWRFGRRTAYEDLARYLARVQRGERVDTAVERLVSCAGRLEPIAHRITTHEARAHLLARSVRAPHALDRVDKSPVIGPAQLLTRLKRGIQTPLEEFRQWSRGRNKLRANSGIGRQIGSVYRPRCA
jgi:hypothetical protein